MPSVLFDNPDSALAPDGAAPTRRPAAGGPVALRPGRVLLLALTLLLAGAALAWRGGGASLGGLALACLGVWLAASQGHRAGPAQRASAPASAPEATRAAAAPYAATRASSRVGAELMVETVVPVWSRQMEVTREATAEGLSLLLNTFAEMSGALHTLTENISSHTVSAEPGAVDQAVRRECPALDTLTAASQRAFDERDHVVNQLGVCADGLQRLEDLARRARELGRQTRMMAFNASIEANRSRSQNDGASQAVASEARMLAARMAETGEQIDTEVRGMLNSVRAAQREGAVKSTSPEELRLEIDLQARQALAAMLGALGGALQSSGDVQQAAQTLKDQLDAAFVHFQFGDRVSQMLSIVGNDMNNFAQWVSEHPRATQTDAAQWLAALESSYTMEEQRSSHHGNVHVQQSSGIEFF